MGPPNDPPPRLSPPCRAGAEEDIEPSHCGGIKTGVAMHPYEDRGLDLYETPPEAVRALLKVEAIEGPIWEPCCGRGAIVRPLRLAGHTVFATDIKDDAYGCPGATGCIDFLQERGAPEGIATVLTNPPGMFATEMVRHALTLVPRVIMMLRFLFLESAGRCDLIDSGNLRRVYPFIDRLPMMHRDGWEGPKVNNNAFQWAWFCWDRNYSGPIVVRRIWARQNGAPPPADPEASK
jgi:hypothetical protein